MANPNINKVAYKGANARSEIGKFIVSLNSLKIQNNKKIPKELLSLYEWAQGIGTKNINQLIEIKNMYSVLKDASIPTLLQKIKNYDRLDKKDLDSIRLMMEMMINAQKIEFGDKHTVEHLVTYKDIMRQMNSEVTIIDAEVISNDTVRQSDDTGRSRENINGQDGSNTRDNKLPKEVQEDS